MKDDSQQVDVPFQKAGDREPDLVIDESDRYSRLRLIGWWDQEKIFSSRVLVVGAGALGNEVIKNLVLLGMGSIDVIDFDEIQDSNLTRSVLFRAHHKGQSKSRVAAEMARELNPDCHLNPIQGDVLADVGLGLIRDVDLVICCVDNREARLWINRMCWKACTPWIDGGIQEINGVAKVFVPPDGACYECAMTENDYRLISLRYSCPLLKQEDFQQGKVPTSPTIASIIGGLQVQEALKLLHGLPVAAGKALVFNGVANQFYQTEFPYREDCMSHETYVDILELKLSAQRSTVSDLFAAIETVRGESAEGARESMPSGDESDRRYSLQLDRDFLTQFVCRTCDKTRQVNRAMNQVAASEGLCAQCGEPVHPESVCEVDSRSELADRTLAELGIPDYDILKVNSGDLVFHVLLSDDASLGQRRMVIE